MHARSKKNYCQLLAILSRGLKIIPTYGNLQIEDFTGIQTHKKPNLDRKISIPAGLTTRSNYKNYNRILYYLNLNDFNQN